MRSVTNKGFLKRSRKTVLGGSASLWRVRGRLSSGFLSLSPPHQLAHRASSIAPARQDFRYLRCNRQLDAGTRAEREGGVRRSHAFGHHLGARQNLVERATMSQFHSDMAVSTECSRTRQHEIAEPCQSG